MPSRRSRPLASTLAAALAAAVAGCSGGGAQSSALMPAGNVAGSNGTGGVGNAVVRIFVPATPPNGFGRTPGVLPPPPPPAPVSVSGTSGLQGAIPQPMAPTPGPMATNASPGAQILSININGPTPINQTIAVGPNAGGCVPAAGGTNCQLSLALPAGTYAGTIGAANAASPTGIAFTVAPNSQNVFGLTTGGVPAQVAVVPASSLSGQNTQGGELDLFGAGRHPLLVEALDANGNVIVGNAPATFTLNQAGGTLPLTIAQTGASSAPNLFYATPAGTANSNAALLRATANYQGPGNPCAQASAVCNGTTRVGARQLLAVANSNANDVTFYVNGQSAPLIALQNGIFNPQALIFDPSGDLFVANQPGSVTVYAAPYNVLSTTISSGVNRPQALALDTREDLFVANGSGSNTITVYAPPYAGSPAATIIAGVDDPVSLAVDASSNLFVVNAAANTVTEYQPPYSAPPTVISKGLNAPNSLALDVRGNLFVANLNSTPNSVVEFSPPFSNQSAPVATITNGVNEQGAIGLNGSANLFVPNQGANNVTEYVAPYVNPPTTIVGGQSQPVALAIDASGNLYVANYGNNTVTIYAPPYSNGSWTALSNGISLPQALALSPATTPSAALLP
jgi:hypothetical protein